MTQAFAGPGSASAVALGVRASAGGTTGVEAELRCPGCDARLADDQRFCLACGLRLAPDALRLATLPLLTAVAAPIASAPVPAAGGPASRQPVVRSAAITAVVVLVLGIAIGATIGPAAVSETAAAQRAVILVSAPTASAPAAVADDAPAADDDAGSGGAADEVQTLDDTAGEEPAPVAEEPVVETPAPEDEGAGDEGDDDEPAEPAAPPPGSQALAGVVAAVASDGEGFVLAARDGSLLRVHASGCGVVPGDDLHLRARQLANGTWSADRVRRVAVATDMRVAGTVVWSDPASGRYALGARGVTLFVTVPPVAPSAPATAPTDPQRPAPTPLASTAPPAVPALGAQLRVRLQPVAAHDGQPATLVEQVRRDALPPTDPATPAPAPSEPPDDDATTTTGVTTCTALDGPGDEPPAMRSSARSPAAG